VVTFPQGQGYDDVFPQHSFMPALILKPGREKSLLRRHPWIFSGAIDRVEGKPHPGQTVEIHSAAGEKLALAAFSPQSNIRARVWRFDCNGPVDAALLKNRIRTSIHLREEILPAEAGNSMRLFHGESDGLPGIIADRYGEVVVMQFLSAGAEKMREQIASIVLEQTNARCLYERSDTNARQLEGLPPRSGVLHGHLPNKIVIEEYGRKFQVDIERGQKTGFFLDQRENRKRLGAFSAGRSLLNCFCYSGGFTVHALNNGAASVLSVDSSAEALVLAEKNVALNGDNKRARFMQADVFKLLRQFKDEDVRFDGIILDPPKFAPTSAHAQSAARAYKDINRLAFHLLNKGGWLATFSCSGGIDEMLFQKIVADAALDADTSAVIIDRFHQAADHPVALSFPEGQYLKGLLLQKT
jgi:23S rRNA (cytosine1962-C5)-methyltransferase